VSVETVLLVCIAAFVGLALSGVLLDYSDRRYRRQHAARAQARQMVELARRAEIAESDRATLREHVSVTQRASLAGDLSQVLSILDGPARDDERVKVARDRLDDIRRGL